MKRPSRRPQVRRPTASQSKAAAGDRALDGLAREAIDNFASIITRCGYSGKEAADRLLDKSKRIKVTNKGAKGSAIPRGLSGDDTKSNSPQADTTQDISAHDISSHLLTWWWTDPDYCIDGVPRALPESGPAPSIEALHLRLGNYVSHEAGMRYLISTHSIQQVGTYYIPLTREVSHRGVPDSHDKHQMRVLSGFLRAMAQNADTTGAERPWFAFVADNMNIPTSKAAAVHEDFRKAAKPFLISQDSNMVRYERAGIPGEPKAWLTIGLWISEAVPLDPSHKDTRKKTNGRSVRRRE